MGNKIEVSIVAPVYNVEKYLEVCLESLVKQDFCAYEIVVVNDGSTDGSPAIIARYAARYPELVRIVEQENAGLGEARNAGVRHARGAYIAFVDSDDWIAAETLARLYETATAADADIVLFDAYNTNEDGKVLEVTKGCCGSFSKPFSKRDACLNSTYPSHAWNRFYKKELFDRFSFPAGWYEDVALVPVIQSWAEKIVYLEEPLYFYRRRSGAITSRAKDARNMDMLRVWQYVMDHVNPKYRTEILYAVYLSMQTFVEFRPRFAAAYVEFFQERRALFAGNPYIEAAIDANVLKDLTKSTLLPKKIHYFWFGGGARSDLIQRCIRSWEKYLPDWEIIEWNEHNCDITCCAFVKAAYEHKKWAFVADYFRFKILYEQGGIYLDTDCELHDSLDAFRVCSAFFAFEETGFIHAGVFGCMARHPLIGDIVKEYERLTFQPERPIVIGNFVTKRLEKMLYYTPQPVLQYLGPDRNVAVYPVNVLTIDVGDGKNVVEHHYLASWWQEGGELTWKFEVLRKYFDFIAGGGDMNAGASHGMVPYKSNLLLERVLETTALRHILLRWLVKKCKACFSPLVFAKLKQLYFRIFPRA